MSIEKNQGGKWVVFAFGLPDHASPGEAVTGDAAQITANVRIDGGAANAVDGANPTELEDGYYVFDITAAESNGDLLCLCPTSATAEVQVIGVPGSMYTTPANFNALGIESDGDLTKVNEAASVTAIAENAITATAMADDSITEDQLAATAVAEIKGAVSEAIQEETMMVETTIAVYTSQTEFTLTAGSADDNAYNGGYMVIEDQTTAAQQCIGDITDYTGATKTITLGSDPGIFTYEAGDVVRIYPAAPGTTPPTAAAIVNEWETQSQADPTGFHVNVKEIDGDAQSLADLKDFADAGYDPATNKVQGVVTVDTTTTNTDMVGTDSAALASVCTEARLSELDAGTVGKAANQIDEIRTDTGEIGVAGAGLTEAGGDGDHLTEAGGDGDHLTEAGGDGDHLVEAGGDGDHLTAIPEVDADVVKISGDGTAADNLESYCDGTTPQPVNVTEVSGDSAAADALESYCDGTTSQPVDVVKISGDATAADNLESYCDGTTPQPANMTQISGSATAADNLEASALGIVPGACEGVPTTTVVQTDLVEATDDHYIGRVIVFTSGDAAYQASDITDYTGATGTVTITAITTAPAATDTFVIV